MKWIVRNEPGGLDPDLYTVTVMQYNIDQWLWLLRKFTCRLDEQNAPIDVTWLICREFRYDGDRPRYLVRERDPLNNFAVEREYWRDYLGDNIHRDFDLDTSGELPVAVPGRRYVFGYGLAAMEDPSLPSGQQVRYVHGDMLGSTRLITSSAGSVTHRVEYLAFGQLLESAAAFGVPKPDTRYAFCGSWGYQNDDLELGLSTGGGSGDSSYGGDGGSDDVGDPNGGGLGGLDFGPGGLLGTGLLHVGARYYSPDLGRFVQRDPIGVNGGLNVYAYVNLSPTWLIDPLGRESLPSVVSVAGATGGLTAISLGGTQAAAEIAAAVGVSVTGYLMIRTPSSGLPDSSAVFPDGDTGGTIRIYGPDGRALQDIDFGHDHGAGDPHVHDWDWTKELPRGKGQKCVGDETWP